MMPTIGNQPQNAIEDSLGENPNNVPEGPYFEERKELVSAFKANDFKKINSVLESTLNKIIGTIAKDDSNLDTVNLHIAGLFRDFVAGVRIRVSEILLKKLNIGSKFMGSVSYENETYSGEVSQFLSALTEILRFKQFMPGLREALQGIGTKDFREGFLYYCDEQEEAKKIAEEKQGSWHTEA